MAITHPILTAGFVAGIIIAAIVNSDSIPILASTLGPLTGAVVGWYFREKAGK